MNSSNSSIVFGNSRYIFKFIHSIPQSNRENELFYSFHFDKMQNHDIYLQSLSNEDSTIICMKNCKLVLYQERNLISNNYFDFIIPDLISQINLYHSNFVIHNDIKASNLVYENGKWILIDFGLMQKYHPLYIHNLHFKSGTPNYNIPNYEINKLNNMKLSDQLFWMYMKDWYAFGKIIQSYVNEEIGLRITNTIESMNKHSSIQLISKLLNKATCKNCNSIPFYLL